MSYLRSNDSHSMISVFVKLRKPALEGLNGGAGISVINSGDFLAISKNFSPFCLLPVNCADLRSQLISVEKRVISQLKVKILTNSQVSAKPHPDPLSSPNYFDFSVVVP